MEHKLKETNGRHDSQADGKEVRPGERPQRRALSISSVASSSVAATSIMGDLSDSSLDDANEMSNASSSPSKRANEVDRHGFTGGSQYTDPIGVIMSVEKIRYREQKWLAMLNSWDKWMARRFGQVKNRCRKGIPQSLRGRAWQLLSGSKSLYENNKGKYEMYLSMEADANCIEDIEKDLHRQFPFHEMFVEKGGTGQQDLRDVLRAYSVYNPEDGYCQAQAPVAAVLLMHMPAEQAFWCMVAMCEHYLQGYFSPGLEALQVDGHVMQSLLRKVSPVAHKHLEKQQVSPLLYMTEWFMCVFARTLPWPSVLRLWDMFFCEGIKVVFRCALVLLRSTLGMTEKVKKLPGLYETMEALRKIDPSYMREDRLMFEIVNLKISERDLENEHRMQRIKWKKGQGMGPSGVSAGKEGKRVYRYTPTFRLTESSANRGVRTNSKKISAISANSSMIIAQTRTNKKASRKKKGVESDAANKSGAPPVIEDSVVEDKAPDTSNTEPNENVNTESQKTVKEIVTSFSAKSPELQQGWTNSKSDSIADEKAAKSSHENTADEITVF